MKNELFERLLKFAVDVILYLRTVKNTVEIAMIGKKHRPKDDSVINLAYSM